MIPNPLTIPKVLVISGIDTDVGKTVVTGMLARWMIAEGKRVVTMKMVQTGCGNLSEDIVEHRKLSGVPLLEEDALGITCPYVFPVPCSPHLAARLAGERIDPQRIAGSIIQLSATYQAVLAEGAGGLFVPLNDETLLIDLVMNNDWPLVLVTSPRLGSINHTLSAVEACHRRGIVIQGLVYNLADASRTDPRIVDDTRSVFKRHLQRLGYPSRICDVPAVACTQSYCVDFSPLFSLEPDH